MKRSKFTDEQILAIVREGGRGRPEGRRLVSHAWPCGQRLTQASEVINVALRPESVDRIQA